MLYITYILYEIFEFRIKYGSNITRILYFYSKDNTAVITNGFIKKTVLTPKSKIELVKKRRKEYLEMAIA